MVYNIKVKPPVPVAEDLQRNDRSTAPLAGFVSSISAQQLLAQIGQPQPNLFLAAFQEPCAAPTGLGPLTINLYDKLAAWIEEFRNLSAAMGPGGDPDQHIEFADHAAYDGFFKTFGGDYNNIVLQQLRVGEQKATVEFTLQKTTEAGSKRSPVTAGSFDILLKGGKWSRILWKSTTMQPAGTKPPERPQGQSSSRKIPSGRSELRQPAQESCTGNSAVGPAEIELMGMLRSWQIGLNAGDLESLKKVVDLPKGANDSFEALLKRFHDEGLNVAILNVVLEKGKAAVRFSVGKNGEMLSPSEFKVNRGKNNKWGKIPWTTFLPFLDDSSPQKSEPPERTPAQDAPAMEAPTAAPPAPGPEV